MRMILLDYFRSISFTNKKISNYVRSMSACRSPTAVMSPSFLWEFVCAAPFVIRLLCKPQLSGLFSASDMLLKGPQLYVASVLGGVAHHCPLLLYPDLCIVRRAVERRLSRRQLGRVYSVVTLSVAVSVVFGLASSGRSEQTRKNFAKERSDSRHACADDANGDLDSRPIANLDVILYTLLVNIFASKIYVASTEKDSRVTF